ncbi:hypothetical protein [Methanobrevibacter sp.]
MVEKKCKYFYSEPYMTPNNFDLEVNVNEIPANIPKEENILNLGYRLQKLMPPTKYLHLNLDSQIVDTHEHIDIVTGLKVNNKRVEFL